MESVQTYLKWAVEENASDLFVVAGRAVSIKRDGELVSIQGDRLMPDDSEALVRELYNMAHRSIDRCISVGDDDFSLSVTGLARFRVNTYRQRGSLSAVIRIVSFGIPNWREMDIPEEIMKIANMTRGMVLVIPPPERQEHYQPAGAGHGHLQLRHRPAGQPAAGAGCDPAWRNAGSGDDTDRYDGGGNRPPGDLHTPYRGRGEHD